MDIKGDLDLCSAVSNPFCDLIIKARTWMYILCCSAEWKSSVNLSWDMKVGLAYPNYLKFTFFPLFLGNIKRQHSCVCCSTSYFWAWLRISYAVPWSCAFLCWSDVKSLLVAFICFLYLLWLQVVIFQACLYSGFCNLCSYLFCCMTRSEKFAFLTRVIPVTSSIHTEPAHRRITFHVCIVPEKYVLFFPPLLFLISCQVFVCCCFCEKHL